MMTDCDDARQYQCSVDRLVDWCDKNHLIINTIKKTEEIICGLAPGGTTPPVAIHGIDIEQVLSYKYLGVMIDATPGPLILTKFERGYSSVSIPYADLDRLVIVLRFCLSFISRSCVVQIVMYCSTAYL